jgi:inner membrane protein
MTVYGTRILLPFSDYPVGLGSLFIIDPLYTLPLLLGLVVTLVVRSSGRYRWNAAGLVLSSLYAGWALLAQLHVTEVATRAARASGLPTAPVLVTPTPFNTLLWRVVLIDQDHYWEGFHSLFDPARDSGPQIRFERFERGAALDRRTLGFVDADLVRAFSKGFYALGDDGRFIHITDLRMGQSPYFPFSFAFAEHHSEPLRAIEPIELRRRIPFEDGIHWLTRRLQGIDTPSPRG